MLSDRKKNNTNSGSHDLFFESRDFMFSFARSQILSMKTVQCAFAFVLLVTYPSKIVQSILPPDPRQAQECQNK